ncbi:hypothetical protein ACFVIY_26655 [Streptomyces sp. NPDC127166]|uniref:hypothetical protein n=1 Tax=Streptomyces sp. NPDC127166 TaxID=3345380 RepID=UPI003630CC4E
MEIKSLKELQAVDERTLNFTPLGLGHMRPEDSADFQQRVVAGLRLADDVTETTRARFEQLRTAFIHGVLCYELFTLVEDSTRLTLEQALRDRFADYHEDQEIEIRDFRGRVRRIPAGDYPEFFRLLRKIRNPEIRMGASQDWERFNGMLAGLLTWARREGLLRGQRNRRRDPSRQALRNMVAHGTYHLTTPVDAARSLSDLAETVNHLWGQPTPDGHLYPGPVKRPVIAIGWSAERAITVMGLADQLADAHDDIELTYTLVRAVHGDPDLMQFDSRRATTAFPAQYLWGPGTREEALAWMNRAKPTPDTCDYLDQIVVVRTLDGQVDLPTYPGIAAGLPEEEQTGLWHAVRVDRPLDALGHIRAVMGGEPGHEPQGECENCPADTVATGDLTTVLKAVQEAGADTEPLYVPDLRTPIAAASPTRFGKR